MTSLRRRVAAAFLAVSANERMTVVAGFLLLPLLGVETLTALSVRRLLPIHLAVGLWLLPLVAVKMLSTGYRMVMYYLRDHDYFRAGPPSWLPRLLAPLVVISTLGLFGSGTILWAAGPAARDPWLSIHKVSFVLWGASTGIHVLIHLRHTVTEGMDEITSHASGRNLRAGVAIGAVLLGLLLGGLGFNRGPAWPAGGGDEQGSAAPAGS
ncbi:MAG: hypothetical protein ACYDGR_03530 [Candidatus Dormibacteria bacterium]